MKNIDNMGGVISAEFILQKECKSFAIFANQCRFLLAEGASWKSLKMQQQSFNVKIQSKNEDAGMYYQITGSVNLVPYCENVETLALNMPLIIKYQLVDGNFMIIGTYEYPLITTFEYLHPQKSSSFKGYQLSFEGKQLVAPPLFII